MKDNHTYVRNVKQKEAGYLNSLQIKSGKCSVHFHSALKSQFFDETHFAVIK